MSNLFGHLFSMILSHSELSIRDKNVYLPLLHRISYRLPAESLWDYVVDIQNDAWIKCEVALNISATPSSRFIVPTTSICRTIYVSKLLYHLRRPIMFTGEKGAGKTTMGQALLNHLVSKDVTEISINYSNYLNCMHIQVFGGIFDIVSARAH